MRTTNGIKIAPHFWLYEFECPCCNRIKLDSQLLQKLNYLRVRVNRPIYITSGYRCENENIKVGGTRNSYHLYGKAADIYTKNMNTKDLALYAESVGFKGIGLYDTHIHVDVRTIKKVWDFST